MNSLKDKICAHLSGGATVFLCGNGGSAAIAQHVAAELVVKFGAARRPLPALALSTDSSVVTAHANDFGFETLFRRQLEAFCRAGDIVLLMSTSGKSQNILLAAQFAVERGAFVIALTGPHGLASAMEDVEVISFEHDDTAAIQEAHLRWLHELCRGIDEHFA